RALSGGEAARLVFARLQVEQPNIIVLDEPTNHLDLESIEALVAGLRSYDGTLILVSHDRWFVSQLATRVVEISHAGIRDYHGTYDEYVHACGDDHLDADNVVLKARREERRADPGKRNGKPDVPAPTRHDDARRGRLERRRDEITAEIEGAEASIAAIDEAFCRPGYYEGTPPEEVAALEGERAELQGRV